MGDSYGPAIAVDWGKVIVIALILGTMTVLSVTGKAEGVPIDLIYATVLGYLMGNGRVAWNTRRKADEGYENRRRTDVIETEGEE